MTHFIFVLGHANNCEGKLSGTGQKRIECAAAIWRTLGDVSSTIIVLTGGFAKRFNVTDQPHWKHAKTAIMGFGLPGNAIHEEGLASRHTVEDAVLILQFLRTDPNSLVTIVTSQNHVARSRMIFACLAPERNFKFVGAMDPDEENARLHECRAIKHLREQGGVVWEDKLFPIPHGYEE